MANDRRIGALGMGGAPKGYAVVSDGHGWISAPGANAPPVKVVDATTTTFDLSQGLTFETTLRGDRTLTLANVEPGQAFALGIHQDSIGGRLVTWFAGILWAGSATPVLSTAPGSLDVFTFKCVDNGVFWGFASLNHGAAS